LLYVIPCNAECRHNMKNVAMNDNMLQEAKTLISKGELNKAASLCDEALVIDPVNLEALMLSGESYLKLDNTEMSEKRLRRALEIAPKHAWALRSMGELLTKLQKYEEAEQYLNKAFEEGNLRHNASVHASLCKLYIEKGNKEKALEHMARHQDGRISTDYARGRGLFILWQFFDHFHGWNIQVSIPLS